MIPYIGCETSREMLDAFLDGELALADQVAVESHLRWCRTCAARIEDMQLIGGALRGGVPGQPQSNPEDRDLGAIQSGVLIRIRAERDQSFPVRLRAMCEDMHLFWPAVGATAALVACLFSASWVLRAATAENPESLAAMIERLDRPASPTLPPANPGSDQNPLRLDGRVSFPRVLDTVPALDALGDDEVAFAVSAVVTREGRIATYDLLQSERANVRRGQPGQAGHYGDDATAVLDMVKRSRFAPAEAAGGTKVAVNMVWLLVRTTARGNVSVRSSVQPAAPTQDLEKEPEVADETPQAPSTERQVPPISTPA